MKKTLFAMAALATVMPAMAANWKVAAGTQFTILTDITATKTDYALYLYRDEAANVASVTGNISAMTYDDFISVAGTKYDFSIYSPEANRLLITAPFTSDLSVNGTATEANQIWGVCVYHGNAADAQFAVVQATKSNTAGQLKAFNGTSATYTAFKSDSPATPEPATATLSLMALAGLASRRRRK
ncbi:MAG: PEP-CTERM sorting domain-containing protein [Akkermansia sp.]|nr:PEP-CTERM sorting domain-containing protein [Akkermansia sp.]